MSRVTILGAGMAGFGAAHHTSVANYAQNASFAVVYGPMAEGYHSASVNGWVSGGIGTWQGACYGTTMA
jgi:hypothetical protein